MGVAKSSILVASRCSRASRAIADAVKVFMDAGLRFKLQNKNVITWDNSSDLLEAMTHLGSGKLLRNTAAIIDITDELPLPLGNHDSAAFPQTSDELVLSYPEIYFIFIVRNDQMRQLRKAIEDLNSDRWKERNQILDCHFVSELGIARIENMLIDYQQGFHNLYDASLLRWFVGNYHVFDRATNEASYAPKQAGLTEDSEIGRVGRLPEIVVKDWTAAGTGGFSLCGLNRYAECASNGQSFSEIPLVGVSLEDEASQCQFNAYFLYRRGCGVYVVKTFAEFDRLFPGPATRRIRQQFQIDKILEDAELYFPDASEDTLKNNSLIPSQDPSERNNGKNLGELLRNRHAPGKQSISRANMRDLKSDQRVILSFSDEPHGWEGVSSWQQKPICGLYDRKLSKVLGKLEPVDVKHEYGHGHHSCPGKAQYIGEHLIIRAREIYENAIATSSIEEALHAAVLVEESLRVLGGLSPQLSLEALELRHEAEVLAECLFHGSARSLNKRNRWKSLKTTVRSILRQRRWTSYGKWKQRNNTLISIAGDLRQIYQKNERFVEERWMLNRLRFLENWLSPFWPAIPFLQYFTVLLSYGILAILSGSLLFVVLFSLFYPATTPPSFNIELLCCRVSENFMDSLIIWFTGKPPPNRSDIGQYYLIEDAIALVHLGILVSWIYDRIKRDY